MPNVRIAEAPALHIFDGGSFRQKPADDNLTSPTQANLPAIHKTGMIVGLRNEIGQENMHTFPGVRPGISSLRSRLIADPLVDPYVSYLNNTRNLTDQHVVAVMSDMVQRLGKPALPQHVGSPIQYVSHGFDHSERVAAYTDKIIKAYPEIEDSAARKYNNSPSLAHFLFKTLAHWHDVGYPDLDRRPKSTHGLSSASRFDSVRDPLANLVQRENGRTDQVLSDMRRAIQLHSADVDAKRYPISVKTDQGSLLVQGVDSLKKLLTHYSVSSRRPHQVSEIEIRSRDAKALETQVGDILKTRFSSRPIKVTADESQPEYAGRPASLDKNNQVKVGLRYTEQELTENPFAVIRLADNLDMASDRLSPLQQHPAFRAMYWKLGDRGPIGRALSELSKLDRNNTTAMPDILRDLRSAAVGSDLNDAYGAVLSEVAKRFAPGAVYGLNASTAQRFLTRATEIAY
jgi:hypothetical protein